VGRPEGCCERAERGVSFAVARRAFDDLSSVELEDRREDYGDDRYVLLGMV
jgi:uncharacterized DUF497 family protein